MTFMNPTKSTIGRQKTTSKLGISAQGSELGLKKGHSKGSKSRKSKNKTPQRYDSVEVKANSLKTQNCFSHKKPISTLGDEEQKTSIG
jgi:hypothetical protein